MNKDKNQEYRRCFACGVDNPIGLKLKFEFENDEAFCRFSLEELFEGYPGIIHGGIVSTVLDEAMAKIILASGEKAVTIDMKTKFRKSLQSNKEYLVKSLITRNRKRIIITKAEITCKGEVYAESEAKFFKKNL